MMMWIAIVNKKELEVERFDEMNEIVVEEKKRNVENTHARGHAEQGMMKKENSDEEDEQNENDVAVDADAGLGEEPGYKI